MNIHYQVIKEFYGDRKANRSQVPLVNHIDEGLVILNMIGASLSSKEAFCLHPLLQENGDLTQSLERNNYIIKNHLRNAALILAMEYRAVANAYLFQHCLGPDDNIQTSSIAEVNCMLVADKVQNRKDFEIYHLGKHKNSDMLTIYFNNWLGVLNISEHQYQNYVEALHKHNRCSQQDADNDAAPLL